MSTSRYLFHTVLMLETQQYCTVYGQPLHHCPSSVVKHITTPNCAKEVRHLYRPPASNEYGVQVTPVKTYLQRLGLRLVVVLKNRGGKVLDTLSPMVVFGTNKQALHPTINQAA